MSVNHQKFSDFNKPILECINFFKNKIGRGLRLILTRGDSYADRAEWSKETGGRDWCGCACCANRHRRNHRNENSEVGQGSLRESGREGSFRETIARGADGNCQEGSRREVEVMATGEAIKPNYARVKYEVARLHDAFGIISPPVDPVKIARGLGVTVYFVKFENNKQNISGFFDCEERAIFVNKDEYPLRQTFTIAHELGHKVLHEEWAKSSDYKMLLRDQDYSGDEPHEKEANAFAAHLLVPRFLLDQYWSNLSLEQLSQLFAVSVPMIKNRLAFEYGV